MPIFRNTSLDPSSMTTSLLARSAQTCQTETSRSRREYQEWKAAISSEYITFVTNLSGFRIRMRNLTLKISSSSSLLIKQPTVIEMCSSCPTPSKSTTKPSDSSMNCQNKQWRSTKIRGRNLHKSSQKTSTSVGGRSSALNPNSNSLLDVIEF